jgi:hypothetical protein
MPFSGSRKTQFGLKATPTRKYGTLSHGSASTLIPSAIASAEAFGSTAIINPRAALTGGKTRLGAMAVSKRKYASFAFKNEALLLEGIASAEAFGLVIIAGGTLQVSPSSIASAEAVGSHTLDIGRTISLTGLASDLTFGTTEIVPQGTIAPFAIDDGQKLAEWDPNAEPDLAGYRVHIGVVSTQYNNEYDVGLTGTPSAPSYVIGNLTPGVTYYVAITAYDTSNNESDFSPEGSFVATAGIRFGDVNVIGNRALDLSAIASGETFGTHTIARGNVTVIPLGTTSGEAFGSHFIVVDSFFIGGIGIASAEAFGTPALTTGDITVTLDTPITTAEAFGTITFLGTELIENVGAIASLEGVGTPLVEHDTDRLVRLIQIDSSEAFGVAQFDLDIALTGLASEETIGALATNVDMALTGIASDEAFGTHTLARGDVDVFPFSIASLESIGTHVLIPGEIQLPVRVFSARARTFTFPAAR